MPPSERFNLADQIRRAALSIVSNIAEGSRRVHRNEKRQFYSVAYGSASELEAQLTIITDLNLVSAERIRDAEEELQHVLRLMNRLVGHFR